MVVSEWKLWKQDWVKIFRFYMSLKLATTPYRWSKECIWSASMAVWKYLGYLTAAGQSAPLLLVASYTCSHLHVARIKLHCTALHCTSLNELWKAVEGQYTKNPLQAIILNKWKTWSPKCSFILMHLSLFCTVLMKLKLKMLCCLWFKASKSCTMPTWHWLEHRVLAKRWVLKQASITIGFSLWKIVSALPFTCFYWH